MSDQTSGNARQEPRIRVSNNGPYQVSGGAQLTTRTPVLDQHGDAVAWTEGPVHKSSATYVLCRCGQSRNKPFCDGSHQKVGFDGTCTADRAPSAARRKVYAGVGIVMTANKEIRMVMGSTFRDVNVASAPSLSADAATAVAQAALATYAVSRPSGTDQYSTPALNAASAINPSAALRKRIGFLLSSPA